MFQNALRVKQGFGAGWPEALGIHLRQVLPGGGPAVRLWL